MCLFKQTRKVANRPDEVRIAETIDLAERKQSFYEKSRAVAIMSHVFSGRASYNRTPSVQNTDGVTELTQIVSIGMESSTFGSDHLNVTLAP